MSYYTYVNLVKGATRRLSLIEQDSIEEVYERLDILTERSGMMAFMICDVIELAEGERPRPVSEFILAKKPVAAPSPAIADTPTPVPAIRTRQRKDPEPVIEGTVLHKVRKPRAEPVAAMSETVPRARRPRAQGVAVHAE